MIAASAMVKRNGKFDKNVLFCLPEMGFIGDGSSSGQTDEISSMDYSITSLNMTTYPIKNLQYLIILTIPTIILAESLSLMGITTPHQILIDFLLKGNIFLSFCFLGSFIIFLGVVENKKLILVTVLLGLLIGTLHTIIINNYSYTLDLLNLASGFGFAGIIVIIIKTIRSSPEELSLNITALVASVGIPLFFMAMRTFIILGEYLHPNTYDYLLYMFDNSLGVQPSFLLGSIINKSFILNAMCIISYVSLPMIIAYVFVVQLRTPNTVNFDIITFCLIIGLIGYLLYNVYPASGPVYRFGKAFPDQLPLAAEIPLMPFPLSSAPRNAMPSLHMAWAIAIWWGARCGDLKVRLLAGIFLALTFISTLGLGEHYIIDLVVAVPFSVAVQAACMTILPFRSRNRYLPLLIGSVLTIFWLIFLRFSHLLLDLSPWLSWSFVIITLALPLSFEWRLNSFFNMKEKDKVHSESPP